jgi:hypothetical protein
MSSSLLALASVSGSNSGGSSSTKRSINTTTSLVLSQAQRRKEFIHRQKHGRSAVFDRQRQQQQQTASSTVATTASQDEFSGEDVALTETIIEPDMQEETVFAMQTSQASTNMNSSSGGSRSNRKKQEAGAKHKQESFVPFNLCVPEYMLEIPQLNKPTKPAASSSFSSSSAGSDMVITEEAPQDEDEEPESWMFKLRPRGTSCLISTSIHSNGSSSHGLAYAISPASNSSILCSFRSLLPKNCVLECILDEEHRLLYAMDILMWKGQCLTDTTSEFRMYWLQTKLSECSQQLFRLAEGRNEYAVQWVPYFDCTPANLYGVYANENGACPYVPDGFVFYHKFGHYQQGLTPLVLAWKDANCSRYVQDAVGRDDEGNDDMMMAPEADSEGAVDGLSKPIKLVVHEDYHIEDEDRAMTMGEEEQGVANHVNLSCLDGFPLTRHPKQVTVGSEERKIVVLKHGDLVVCRCQQIGYRQTVGEGATSSILVPFISGGDQLIIDRVTPRARVKKAADSWSKIVTSNANMVGYKVISFDDLLNSAS